MLKRLAKQALLALAGADDGPDERPAPATIVDDGDLDDGAQTIVATREIAELEDRIVQLERIKGEYFEVIERIADERDQWKRMFFDQSRKHLNAQALLERAIGLTRRQLHACVTFIKAKEGADAVAEMAKVARAVDAPPLGTAMEYGKKMLALAEAQAPKDTDAEAEQKRLSILVVEIEGRKPAADPAAVKS